MIYSNLYFLQFTIHIVNGPTSCNTGMKFVALTLPENIRVPYPPNRPHLINGVYLETPDVKYVYTYCEFCAQLIKLLTLQRIYVSRSLIKLSKTTRL